MWTQQGVKINYKNVKGVLIAEPPVSCHGVIKGACSLGFLTYIGARSELYNGTSVGRFCSIAASVTVGAPDHPIEHLTTHLVSFDDEGPFSESSVFHQWHRRPSCGHKINKGVTIGSDVWIGRNAYIKSGVNIGHGAIVGAGAVVTRDVAAYSVVGGVPAEKIKMRFSDDIIKRLLVLRWWDYDISRQAISHLDLTDIELSLSILERLKSRDELSLNVPEKIRIVGG